MQCRFDRGVMVGWACVVIRVMWKRKDEQEKLAVDILSTMFVLVRFEVWSGNVYLLGTGGVRTSFGERGRLSLNLLGSL